MTFRTVDELLTRQMTGESGSPAAEHLGMRLTVFARGVAVYELPIREHLCGLSGRVDTHVIAALAEEAMTAAAMSALSDDHDHDGVLLRDLQARFERAVCLGDATTLRAEALVTRAAGETVSVVADVLCGEDRVATFQGECERPAARFSRANLRVVA